MSLDATPWVERTMSRVWERVAAVVPESWLPVRGDDGKLVEFGCGHYGCVMPTRERGLVCKVTTDTTEARFIAQALSLPPTEGIVEYKKIYALREAERSYVAWGRRHSRPMFVLWRSEAFDVGSLSTRKYAGEDAYEGRVRREGISFLDQFRSEASLVQKWVRARLRALDAGVQVLVGGSWGRAGREVNKEQLLQAVWDAYQSKSYYLVGEDSDTAERRRRSYYVAPGMQNVFGAPSWVRGLQRIGVAINNCSAIAQELENLPHFYSVGRALGRYLDEGLLLADVHLQNIGRDAEGELVITDPGHAVAIHPRWAQGVTIEEI